MDGIAQGVDERVALVAHEMRTPLTVACAAAETLQRLLQVDEPDLPEIARMATVVQRHSRLASRLLDRLGLAREIRQGEVRLAVEAHDLGRLVADMVDDVATFVLPTRTVTVVSDGFVPTMVDPGAVSEIVLNLLLNAAKYSPGTTAIEVLVEQDEGLARLVVRDHGTGVAPGDAERIFEEYCQSDPANSGLGLGLFVSRSLARALGGDLSVRDAGDGGSEFVLEVPGLVAVSWPP